MQKTTFAAIATDACRGAGVWPWRRTARAASGKARGAHPHRRRQNRPAARLTPESRSAAALALSHEPTFDEGSAQRIREAALSYSDIAVRGGWPAIPAEAKFAWGAGSA